MRPRKPIFTNDKYILDTAGNPIPEFDLLKWAEWFEKKDRRVASTKVGKYSVSTVFLAMDYSFSGSKPLLFETMVFDDEEKNSVDADGLFARYSTRKQALKGHDKIVALVKAKT